MNKKEALAYLRKKVLLERLGMATDTNPDAAAELDNMEKPPEEEKKNLTNAETSCPAS